MVMLCHIGDKRFVIKEDKKIFLVSLSKSTANELNNDEVESILRQGYWQKGYHLDKKKEEAIASIIHPT